MLTDYYTETLANGYVRSGARFDTWAGGGDEPGVANQITGDDILAASFLSVDYSPKAVIGILETRRAEITGLLELIPPGVGPTRASKLMARKRPHLIPIWDSVVRAQTGLRDSSAQWSDWHELLVRDEAGIATRLDDPLSRYMA